MICRVQNSEINLPSAMVGSRLPCQRNVMVAGSPSLFSMALTARKVDLFKRGHNDLRDSDAKLADMAFGGVVVEPIMVPQDDRTGQPALRADWLARGV